MTTPSSEASPKAKISALVSSALEGRDKTGKIELPEDTNPYAVEAVHAEIRRRDTASSFTKSQQALQTSEAEREALLQTATLSVDIPPEEQKKLDELKLSDPDEWFKAKTALETRLKADLAKKIKGLSEEGLKAKEAERRAKVLTDYQKANPEFNLSLENLVAKVPPYLFADVDSGKITFEEMLTQAKLVVEKGTAVAGAEVMGDHNLGDAGGGSTPSGGDAETKPASWKDLVV